MWEVGESEGGVRRVRRKRTRRGQTGVCVCR